MKQKKFESGRSLIEIIAILVILAILLIAALLGFKALLDYLKRKQSADEIATLSMRYKVNKLQARKAGGQIRVKDFYPEGTPCDSGADCIKTPDGGNLRLASVADSSSFVVVAKDLNCVSCREALFTGAYGVVVQRDLYNNFTGTDSDETIKLGNKAYTPEQIKAHPEYVDNICKESHDHPGNQDENHFCDGTERAAPVSFVFGDKCEGGAKYLVNGQCSFCPAGKVKAPKGRHNPDSDGCCDKDDVPCGFCGGCEKSTVDKDYCVNDRCVECVDNDDCRAVYGYLKPYCGTDGFCKPCVKPGDPCRDESGAVMGGVFCDSDLTCRSLCSACYEPDTAVPGRCKLIISLGEVEEADCNPDASCPQCAAPMSCNLMADGSHKCQCPNSINQGDVCSAICPCTDGSECRNGICTPPSDCSALETNRFFGKACIPLDCPCASDLLQCPGETKICECADLPIKKEAPCWGECGCGASLVCSVTTPEEGTCQCATLNLGDVCTTNNHGENDCPCTEDNYDGKYTMICDSTFHCACNPEIPEHSLPAGSPCEEDCNQCVEGLQCVNNRCGCETDDDCPAEEHCENKICECDSPLVRDPGTHKCVCNPQKTVTGLDRFWTRFVDNATPPNETYICCIEGEKAFLREGNYMCCEEGTYPIKIGETYQCLPVCGDDNIQNVALILDYSNSTTMKKCQGETRCDSLISTAATTILTTVNNVNPTLKIGVFREDNNHKTSDDSGQMCNGSNNSVTIKAFNATGTPNLSQSTCAYNCKNDIGSFKGGVTCFDDAISEVNSQCTKSKTLVFLLSDGVIPPRIPSSCDNNQIYVYAVFGEDLNDTFGLPLGHEYPISATPNTATWEGILSTQLCIPPDQIPTE